VSSGGRCVTSNTALADAVRAVALATRATAAIPHMPPASSAVQTTTRPRPAALNHLMPPPLFAVAATVAVSAESLGDLRCLVALLSVFCEY
jgi:hypothetical protein